MQSYKGYLRNEKVTTVTTASTNILPGNARRVALLIGSLAATSIHVKFGGPAVLDASLLIPANAAPIYLDEDMIGQAVREDVFALLAAGTGNVYVLEILAP